MMKESDAKLKWCPMVRLNQAACNTDSQTPVQKMVADFYRCIGSDCMMFVWIPDYKIHLSNGMEADVDLKDKFLVEGIKWSWHGRYVKSSSGFYLHRHLAEYHYGTIEGGYVVDHIDGDPLNNRLGNLRVCTQAENIANSESRGGKSQYRGVYQSRSGKWVAQIAKLGERFTIGTFENEIDAAKAWDNKAKELHGEYAKLNLVSIKNSGRIGDCGLKVTR